MLHPARFGDEDRVLADVRREVADALEVLGDRDQLQKRRDQVRVLRHVGQKLPNDGNILVVEDVVLLE